MRELLPAPTSALDARTFAPNIGSFRGSVPRIELSRLAPNPLTRLAREKRWLYVAISTPSLYLACAVVDVGYAVSAFAYAFDRDGMKLLADASLLGIPLFGSVRQTDQMAYAARFDHPRGVLRIEQRRGDGQMHVAMRMPGLEAHAVVACDSKGVPPALTAIAPVEGGILNTTEKRVLLPVQGRATLGGTAFDLDGALAGYDYTHGLLARRTAWKWAFFCGNGACDGKPVRVAMNLVEGFVGEPECAIWVNDELFPVAEGRITFDKSDTMRDWQVRSADGAVDLTFVPGGVHAERTNLGVVASRFIQPVGLYSGTIRLPGRPEITLENVPGVTEDQDSLW